MAIRATLSNLCPSHSPEKVRPFSFPAGRAAADAIAMAKPRRDSSSKATKRRSPADGGVKASSTGKFKSRKRAPLGDNRAKTKKKTKRQENGAGPDEQGPRASFMVPAEALSFFLDQFETANGIKLSSLELEAFKDTSMVELPQAEDQDAANLSQHLRDIFGRTWKEELCDEQLIEGKIYAGNPAVLIISPSAIRCLELLRSLKPLTRECRAVKLFAKHLKVTEQVSMLKSRVNIACGTPSRLKKLIDLEALGLARLMVVLLDMHTDAKGYSLFTLPQVRDEFWDLYKSHFHAQLLQGDLKICLYGQRSKGEIKETSPSEE